MAEDKGTDKGTAFLSSTMMKNQGLVNKGKDLGALIGTLNTFTGGNIKTLNKLTKSLDLLNQNMIKMVKPSQQKKDFVRKEDPMMKLYKSLDDLEPLMRENNKLQKDKEKKKGSFLGGLLGMIGAIGKAMAFGGLLGFLLTGKKEFLFTAVKGVTKYMLGFPIMIAEFIGKKLFLAIGSKVTGLFGKIFGGLGGMLTKIPGVAKFSGIIGKIFKPITSIFSGIKSVFAPLGKLFGGAFGKVAGKVGGGLAKKVFMKIPVIGSLLGLFFGIQRFKKGDVVGGLLEIVSGSSSLLNLVAPGVGLAVGLAIDAFLAFRDVKNAMTPKEEEKPKKGSKTDWRKIPVIGSFLDIFEGIKMMSGGAGTEGLKMALLGVNALKIPGVDWLISKTLFPLVDATEWLIKETPKFLGMVGTKAVAMAPAAYDTLKKVPVIGWYISGIEGLINFTKDPKAGVENIASFMNNMIPGSGDVILQAGGVIFGAADWIMKKASVVAGWAGGAMNWLTDKGTEMISSSNKSSDEIRNKLRESATKKGYKPNEKDAYPIGGVKSGSGIKSAIGAIGEAGSKIKKGAAATIGAGFRLASRIVDLSGISPFVMQPFQAMAAEYKALTGKDIQINSGFRSMQKQQELRDEAIQKYGLPGANKWVAAPGSSMHNYGYAMDLQPENANQLSSMGLLNKYGFDRPMSHEAWHIEPKGLKAKYADVRSGAFTVDSANGIGDAYSIKGNLPSSSISSKISGGNSKLDLSESTIQALAKAMGGSFKNSWPTPRANQVSIDTNIRG